MWNGPSWPHANSIVLSAMANSLRDYAPSALTKEKLYSLFFSFTRAQYRHPDLETPWTGEFYNGDTGEWKTEQRDYNHSTWIDPLISDLIGLIPRNDAILEIDPLLPPNVWTHYLLDGQSYRGHNVTVAYDSVGGRYANGFKGYAVYLDGKEIHHGDYPNRVVYDMAKQSEIVTVKTPEQINGTLTLTVRIQGIKILKGVVRVALFDKASGFPNGKNAAIQNQVADANDNILTVTFANLKPGKYALAVQHDLNKDGKLNRNALGIPTERYGFSNNARSAFSPPSFEEAAFPLESNLTQTITVK